MAAKLEIDSLRALKAVAELGGVTRASNYLSLTQSAVSHKLRRLEDGIECRLLRRQAGMPLLTEDGERLLEYADRIIALHDEALSTLGRKPLEGRIRLGITEDTTCAGLSRILARFSRLYPSVSVNTHVDQSLALERQHVSGKIDLAVMQVFETEIRQTDLVLDRDELVWVQAQDFDLTDRTPLPFIAFDKNCFYRQWAFDQADQNNLRAEIETVLECSSITGICSAVIAGLGIAILNRRYLQRGMLEIVNDFPALPRIAYIVRYLPESASRSVCALADEIGKEFTLHAAK